MIKGRELEKAIASLLRKHRRTFMGNCKCGWSRDLLDLDGGDHADHVGRVAAQCIWALS